MKKKVLLALMAVFCLGIFSSVSTKPVQAASPSKYGLKLYTFPKKFRGNWKRGKSRMKITAHTIYGKKVYVYPKHLKKVPPHSIINKSYFLNPGSTKKKLLISPFEADSFGLYRSGKKLINQQLFLKMAYHK